MSKRFVSLFLCIVLLFSVVVYPSYAEDNTEDNIENNTEEKSIIDIAELSKSIVLIKSYNANREIEGIGSGVIINKSGLIVTNAHVLENGTFYGVVIEGEDIEYLTLSIIGALPDKDLALIKINTDTTPLEIEETDEFVKGQKVVAIGNPLGFESTVSDGIISSIRTIDETEIIQTTAPISPGSSGGALVNMKGELIGITSLVAKYGQNLNFAISSKHISDLLTDEQTVTNMDLLENCGLFTYGESSIIFDSLSYYNNKKNIVNLFANTKFKIDMDIFMTSKKFKSAIEDFYTKNVAEIMKKHGIEKYEFNMFIGNHFFSYKYSNGKFRNKKWKVEEPEVKRKSKEKVLRINLENSSRNNTYNVLNNMFEGLMKEENGEIKYGMAKKYRISDDGKTYTFYLRNANWSDGEPVRASDFEYGWKYVLNPDEYNEYAFQMFCIEGAEAYYNGEGKIEDVGIKSIDDKTLQVTLNQPTPYFLKLVSMIFFMPFRSDMIGYDIDDINSSVHDLFDLKEFICNGPYKIESYILGYKFVLTKNENYYDEKDVKLDKLEFYMIEDDEIALSAYEIGKFDIIENISNEEIVKLRDKKDEEFKILPRLYTWYYVFNTNKAPLDNGNVRKALTLAIDRKSLAEDVLNNTVVGASGLVPHGIYMYDKEEFREKAGDYSISVDKADVKEAKKLLAQAGYPDGKDFPEITILICPFKSNTLTAEAIKNMWEKNLGIKVNIEVVEYCTKLEKESQGDFMIMENGWFGDYNDPVSFLNLMIQDDLSTYSSWSNDSYDELIQKSYITEGKERDKLLLEAEKILMNEMVIMPIYYGANNVMINKDVKDWDRTGLGYWYFGNADIK